MPVFLVLCSAELGKFNSLRPLWRIFCNFSCLVAWSWPLLLLSFSDIRLNFCGMPDFFLLSFRWLSFCIIVFTLVLPTLLLDLFLLYRSLYYARSFGFAFVGFIHMFILFLRVFFCPALPQFWVLRVFVFLNKNTQMGAFSIDTFRSSIQDPLNHSFSRISRSC